MIEYLIRRADGRWFGFPYKAYPDLLRPIRVQSRHIDGWGSHRIEVEGEEISFSDEDSGFMVVFETGVLSEPRASEVVAEICENIEVKSGEKAEAIRIT